MGTYFQALFGIWVLAVTSFFSIDCLASFDPREIVGTSAVGSYPTAYESTYSRFIKIKEECRSVLAEASVLPVDRYRKHKIEKELSFTNGDWTQAKGSAPLMPFTATNSNSSIPFPRKNFNYNVTESRMPINLASFRIEGVDPNKGSDNMVNVRGILQLAISRRRRVRSGTDFQSYPGFSSLPIRLEGAYLELKSSHERLLCMLGSTHLPSRDGGNSLKNSESPSPTLSEDDTVLLRLRYPSKLSLTTRGIRGTLTSLNQHSSSSYFDEIGISSQLTAYSDYEFDSESLVAKACDPHAYPDKLQSKGMEIYRGDSKTIIQLMDKQFLDVVPNWQCNGKDAYCSKLGPFIKDDEVHGIIGSVDKTKLYVQGLITHRSDSRTVKSEIANVSAVFRVVPPSQDQYLATRRTGLNGLTLSAEGRWNSSTGQLCMLGCLGSIKNEDSACNSRICIYIPLSFSIKQRSLIVGSISSIENSPNSFYPLSIELLQLPRYFPWEVLNKMSYSYSKTKLAESMLKKDEHFMKPFWKYPRKELGKTRRSFSLLSQDLSVQSVGFFEPLSKGHFYINLDVTAIEEFVGIGWENASAIPEEVRELPHSKGPEEQQFLKVAAQLRVEGKLSMLSVEGLYDQKTGRMYLIGCRDVRRDVRAPWKNLHDSGDLQDGFDCLIEVKVEYPPTNTRWLTNPTIKLSVTSQRPNDVPLFFEQINIQTLPILYQSQYQSQAEVINSRKTVESVLRILTPSLMIGCILSQLFYSRENTEVAPYISLIMLGLQAIGYSIPLITGAEALFNTMKSELEDNRFLVWSQSTGSESIDYIVKLLLLTACLLTFGLCQKVWKSRNRLLTRNPLEPWRVPSDKRVLFISSGIHAMGFLIVMIVHTVRTSSHPIESSTYLGSERDVHKQHEWETELRKYAGLVQDFFLLPQIVGNFFWHFERKPLRKLYYIGITVLRLLPHIYDYLKPPIFNPYFAYRYRRASPVFNPSFANPGSDFYSMFGDIAIPGTAVVLAIVIFIQQRWNKITLGQTLRLTLSKMTLPGGRRMYERLPLKTFETELVSGCTETGQVHFTAQDKGKVSSL